MTVARLWGCLPHELSEVSWEEYRAMTELLLQQLQTATEGS